MMVVVGVVMAALGAGVVIGRVIAGILIRIDELDRLEH